MNLTQFKRDVIQAKAKGVEIKTTLITAEGEVIDDTPYGSVEVTQQTKFAINLSQRLKWIEFGTAKEWTFEYCKARRNFIDGSQLVVSFNSLQLNT